MTLSTTQHNNKKIPLWSILFWLLIWQLASMVLGSEILLVSPLKVISCLLGLIFTGDFWASVGFTFFRITLGFALSLLAGIALALLSYLYKPIRQLICLPVSVIKITPVASFIILVLIWVPSKNLSIIISFLISFPIMYTSLLQGLDSMDPKLLEMAQVFNIPFFKKARYIYLPQVWSYFLSGCSLAVGLCWKSGIAAEIIGLPTGSMGERLYEAKIYLETPEMFAWTITIIAISLCSEKIIVRLLHKAKNKLEGYS